ncbi:hypothetical protein CR155_00660 [Pollutimonas nitritireducens]|uniref:Uncharacterized protein n=1 Tax=Pollutimonas nitritireducens TaxID=2045209 RepID=A0A2N4UKR0_9BURK|nr:hypothetical protein [Pollutimonas nitritireducens]PLC55603.1 hypothetical protein CR155_00660 [Pollutimonas nitritireducens]
MAAFLPVLKVALPYITQIVSAAVPMFTTKPPGGKLEEVVPQQIRELQAAVSHNAEAVKGLALQLKETIEGVDKAAAQLQQQIMFLRRLAVGAVVVAMVAIGVAVWALSGQ